MNFVKMHGLGNDFVIFDARYDTLCLDDEMMADIADRRRGIGCDTIVVIEPSTQADVFASFFNADGSESGACGNATRCVADIVMRDGGTDACTIAVTYGILECKRKGEVLVEVNMGAAKDVTDLDLSYASVSNPVTVDMGNPHCVFFVDDLESVDVETIGAYVETHEAFPNRTNVEFVQVIDSQSLRQKTWERGVGLTDACGSGACAVAAAALHRGLGDKRVEITLDGGVLTIEHDENGDLLMTGAVAYVFEGLYYA